jgi:signal transduction histidine kinase
VKAPLHLRLTLLVLALLIGMSAALLLLARHYSDQSALESSQRMNLGLARYIVEHQPGPLIRAGGTPDAALMKEIALHVMAINPSVEVYLLDAAGRVIGHALEPRAGFDPIGHVVEMAPIATLVSSRPEELRFPVLGADPMQPGRRTIFSVARVGDGAAGGYLYVVLRGQAAQTLAQSLSNSDALREVAAGLALATALAGVVLVIALRRLTRPLRELASRLRSFRSFRSDERSADAPPAGDEIDVLRAATQSMQRRIDEQFAGLAEADRLRRELVTNISHDLRTPLASIQGYVESVLLRGDQLDATAREQQLRTALRHASLLGKRVNDLFELAKLDAGRVEPQREVFCLAELLQDVIQSYQLAAQQHGVTLHLAAGSQMQARVLADIGLIERALQNLIDNALRFTPAGGEIALGVVADGGLLTVSVSDTGAGIAQEHLPHIFERYWRAGDGADTEPGASAGLGLAIVKRILDLHGAAVRVQSELARGTRVEFALPLAG